MPHTNTEIMTPFTKKTVIEHWAEHIQADCEAAMYERLPSERTFTNEYSFMGKYIICQVTFEIEHDDDKGEYYAGWYEYPCGTDVHTLTSIEVLEVYSSETSLRNETRLHNVIEPLQNAINKLI